MSKKSFRITQSVAKPEKGKIATPISESIPLSLQRFSCTMQCCHNKNWCFVNCEESQMIAFAKKLHQLSQLSWNEIFNSHREGLGLETIDSLDKKKPKTVPKDARVIGLHFDGYKRMVGYRDENAIFHNIWFDHNGKLYKH